MTYHYVPLFCSSHILTSLSCRQHWTLACIQNKILEIYKTKLINVFHIFLWHSRISQIMYGQSISDQSDLVSWRGAKVLQY